MHRRQFAASKYGLAGAIRRACRARFARVGERLSEKSAEELFEAPTHGAARRVKEQLREEDDLRGAGEPLNRLSAATSAAHGRRAVSGILEAV